MARFVGLDVHKRSIVACGLNADGTVAFRSRFDCKPVQIVEFATKQLLRTDSVALEVTTHSLSVARYLTPHVARVVISNPTKTKAIAQATVKTDTVDAKTLAQLLRSDFLPEVWQADPQAEALRALVSFRSQLSGTRTRYINRIRSILQQLMIELPARRLDSLIARDALKSLVIPDVERLQIDSLLPLIDSTEAQITAVDAKLAEISEQTPQIRLLMTLPGLGMLGACSLWAAIGDVSRFPTSSHLSGYLGLAPRVKQSGDHAWYGSITKAGPTEARRLLVIAARHLKTHLGPLGDFYRRLSEHKRGSVAVVAAARKMAEVAWHMLKHDEPYRYAKPDRTRAKLDQLYTRATGKHRPKLPPVSAAEAVSGESPGPGYRRQIQRPINEVYRHVGLPEIDWQRLPNGERKTIDNVLDYVTSLQHRSAIYRKTHRESKNTS